MRVGEKKKLNKPSFEEAWQQRFESFAQNNDDDAGIAGWTATGLEARLRYFSGLWGDRNPNSFWLDAGCGAGTYTRFLANHGLNVVGLDYSLPAIVKAKVRDHQQNSWGVADVTMLPLKSKIFDGALCFGVTQALSNSTPAIKELYRVTKPGGWVWLDALNGYCVPHLWERFRRWVQRKPRHLRYESPKNLLTIMESAGFDCVQLYWLPILPSRWQAYQSIFETRVATWCMHHIPWIGALLSHSVLLKGRRSESS